ncbi:MAG: hypothetical protein KME60_20725 [Cyanomargarita calcarea GSE-NOS-MK-12-04C]|jgi:hypothetical protein|uniref:Uncharacterized protein n=1 Tax=Cyanomargarita calcarea GSE-NOS-MK-12-04C TaxID=2839659 RepID=A0A951QNS4_9CYAN|nr:hypothetical protein [Cyanomargarita calcarea GSE-NOS-MK-12-04C]
MNLHKLKLNEGRRKKEEGRRKRFIYVDWYPNSKPTNFRGWGIKPPTPRQSLSDFYPNLSDF